MVFKKSKKTVSAKSTSSKSSSGSNDVFEKIQKKAYELFEKRGYTNGDDWNDWFEAERVVKRGMK